MKNPGVFSSRVLEVCGVCFTLHYGLRGPLENLWCTIITCRGPAGGHKACLFGTFMFLQLDRTVFHFISLNLTRFLQRMHLVYVIYHLLSTVFGKIPKYLTTLVGHLKNQHHQ